MQSYVLLRVVNVWTWLDQSVSQSMGNREQRMNCYLAGRSKRWYPDDLCVCVSVCVRDPSCPDHARTIYSGSGTPPCIIPQADLIPWIFCEFLWSALSSCVVQFHGFTLCFSHLVSTFVNFCYHCSNISEPVWNLDAHCYHDYKWPRGRCPSG